MIKTPLDYLSVARIEGTDAAAFLHAQLSADISALELGEATFACYCSPRGRVIGLLLVCRRDDSYLVAASAELLPGILARLQMFVLRAKVEFSIRTDCSVYGIEPPIELDNPGTFKPGGVKLHYLLAGKVAGTSGNAERFREQEIRSHVTWLGAEISEKFIPQMLGFDNIGAVSFSKGCYPGQEIIARTRYLGKVKRKPLMLEMQEKLLISPAEQVKLFNEDTWSDGTVIDSAAIDGGGTLLFLVVTEASGADPKQLRYLDQSYRCATI